MAHDPFANDPTMVLAEPSKADVLVRVPTVRQYGITIPGGLQIVYQSQASDEHGAVARVHPDHLDRFIRGVEGAKLLNEAAPEIDQPAAVLTRQGVQLREGVEVAGAPSEPPAEQKAKAPRKAKAKK